ncbi:MAG: right-handed parallel beta-helix repeat-containing protein [Anaerolineales bacterium]|nr:right-handed parallel beta-helix repeat-containing protein [Chloroflexota bacterium]MCC6987341.1 right-handed parallel beta-helix repeat-containing protein [Anaerolineales bacterium]
MKRTTRKLMVNILVAFVLALESFFNAQARSVTPAMADSQSIQQAVDAAQSGATVVIAAGNYQEQVTISKPLTLKADGVVNTLGFVIRADNVTIDGFDITSPRAINNSFGIRAYNANCKILNNYIHDTVLDGILLDGSSSGCLVKGNLLERVSQSGMEVRGTNHVIEGNEVAATIQLPPELAADSYWSGVADADGFRFFGSGHVFRGNYVHDIVYGTAQNPDPHIDCFQTWQDSAPRLTAHDIRFENNYCFLSWEGAKDYPGKVWQLGGGPYNLTMIGNVARTRMTAIVMNGAHDLVFKNNTFIGSGAQAWGVQLDKGTYNIGITDNIFALQENGAGHVKVINSATNSTLTIGHNCVYTATRLPARKADPKDVWGLDPLFVDLLNDDFHLQSNSPCAGMGAYPSSPPAAPTVTATIVPATVTPSPTPVGTQTGVPSTVTPTAIIATGTTPTPLPQTPIVTPTLTAIPPTLPAGISVLTSIDRDTLLVGESGLASVSLNGLPSEGITGVEFTCSYAPDQVSAGNVQIGGIFGDDPASAYNNSQTGSFIYAVAASNGRVINTNGVAFTFSVTGLQSGSSSVECQAKISRANYSLESIASIPDSLTVALFSEPTATPLPAPMLTGQVIAMKPVTISLFNPDMTLAATAMANPDGSFNLIAPAGSFIVVASAEGHLSAQTNVTLLDGATTTIDPITLPAGDIDNNNVIDQYDALTVGMNYNVAASLPADLSNDGLINVKDLEMLAENYRMAGLLTWQQP